MKQQDRIYQLEWLDYHPYDNSTSIDGYYVSLNSLEGEKRGKELVQENLEFFIRFFLPEKFE